MVSFIKNSDPSKELITDRFHDVIDPQFYFSTITEAQNSLMSIPLGQFEFFEKLKVSLIGFTHEPLPHFPELLQWFSQHYSINEKAV